MFKMCRELIRSEEGMMTVEASFHIPLILVLFSGILFFLFFHLDMSAAKGEAMIASQETAAAWKTDGDLVTGKYDGEKLLTREQYFLLQSSRAGLTSAAESRVSSRLKERLILTRVKSSSVKIQAGYVVTRIELEFSWPGRWLTTYTGRDGIHFTCAGKAPVDYREEILRMK